MGRRGLGEASRRGLVLAVAAFAAASCGLSTTPAGTTSKVAVVAAENFWGSIAAQIGGDRAEVSSIIVNPATDPHSYEATPADARLMATARYVIVNGAGYDAWAQKLLDANPVAGRTVLTVGDLVGKKAGDNPHIWYSPAYVSQVASAMASDLAKLDRSDASYFQQQGAWYESVGLKDYHDAINSIKAKYAGTRIGATESIASYLAAGVGLNLITPYTYLKAISEGSDPSVADKAEVEHEIASRLIKVFVYNSQNSTPDVQALVDKARANAIPVVKITETLAPANLTFQQWQAGQLAALLAALGG